MTWASVQQCWNCWADERMKILDVGSSFMEAVIPAPVRIRDAPYQMCCTCNQQTNSGIYVRKEIHGSS